MKKLIFFLKSVLFFPFLISYSFGNSTIIGDTLFEKKNINGTLILSSLKTNKEYVHNKQRALQRYTPASTFKIPNTLIALEEQIIKNDDETIQWDGKKRFYEPWNQNHTLRTALAVSCVWCYQKLAKEIGNEKYLYYLQKIHYGNEKTGLISSPFWIDGDLQISAFEQLQFLKNLYTNDLPFKQENMNITKKILLIEKTDEYSIYAKSGWSGKIGWYIGYIENKKDVWFFVFNGDISKETLPYREKIVMEILKKMMIL